MVSSSHRLADLTKDFTGREWVFQRLNAWLEEDDPRVFLLTGGPGTGKSALVARLLQMSEGEAPAEAHPHLGPGTLTFVHFCRALDESTLSPLRFVEALSQGLACGYELFAHALANLGDEKITIQGTAIARTAQRGARVTGVLIKELHIRNVSARLAFDRAVRGPLEQLCTPDFKETIVILLDALDEALTFDPEDNIITLLGDVTDLPRQVRLVFTSRPDPRVLHAIGEAALLDLTDDAPDDVDDVREYAHRRLGMLSEPRRGELADRIAAEGEGNFLYARYVVDGLLPDVDQIEDLGDLPLPEEGLSGVYRQFLRREMGRTLERWDETYRPLLGALAVARGQGLGRAQLAGVAGLGQSKTRSILRTCAQYLTGPRPDGPFCIYHQSFRDFLLADERFCVYPEEANRAVVEFFLRSYEGHWDECDDEYALRYTPLHLMEAVRQGGEPGRELARERMEGILADLVTDLGFMEAKASRLGIDDVLADLIAAVRLLPSESEQRPDLLALRRVLDRESHNLRVWDREENAALFAQQVYNRAAELGLSRLEESGAARLTRVNRPHLTQIWRTALDSPELERIFSGHTGMVAAVAVTPDGRRAVSASGDNTLKVWDLETGSEERTLEGHTGTVTAVAVTPDGRRAVSASGDQTLKVWDLETGRDERTLEGHSGDVHAVAVTPDGRRAVSASADRTLKVWDLGTGREELALEGHSSSVWAVAVTPDGRRAVSASKDRTLKVWDLETGREERILKGHSWWVLAVAVTPDGRRAVSASMDCTLKVWDLETRRNERTLQGHTDWVYAVAVTPDGRRAISGSGDATAKVWDLETGREKHTLRGHWGSVRAVAVTPDGCRAVSASDDHTLRVWDLETGREERTLKGDSGHRERVRAVAVTADGRRAVSGSDDETLKVWDLETGREERILKGHSWWVLAVAVTPDGRRAVSASMDCTLKVWDLETGREERSLKGHSEPVWAVAVTPDGRLVVSASLDHTLKVWDLETGRQQHTLKGHSEPVWRVAMTPDGRRAVSASDDHTLKVWDLETGREERTLKGHSEPVRAVAVTPDGRRAVSGSFDHTLKVWDLETGESLATAMLDGTPFHIAVEPYDARILAGDSSGNFYCLRFVEPEAL